MNVLITLDQNYAMPAYVMVESLFENSGEKITLFILHSDLSEDVLRRFQEVAQKYGGTVQSITLAPDLFENAHTSIHITKPAYYRLLAFQLLPSSIDRVLYLDPDMIVQKDLTKLYYEDFSLANGKPCYYVVCEGPGVSQKEWSVYDNFGIPHDRLYFNSGVMLMNLAELRRDIAPGRILDFVGQNNSKLKYHDQDTLNALFYDNLKYVDWHIYNQTILHIRSQEEAQKRLKDAAIIHYAGSDKPWNYDYKSYYFELFWKYARKAGYHGLYYVTIVKRILWHVKNKLTKQKDT